MKVILFCICLSVACQYANAQLGFNNPNPNLEAVIDLVSTDKGVLIPRVTSIGRQSIISPVRSLTVFDTDDGRFYYYDGGQWMALNELMRIAGSNDIMLPIGNLTVGGNISATGNLSASQLNVTGFSDNALMPNGAICMWSGSITSIPSGWQICDGTNGTPDLRERFIVGAMGDNPDVTGTGYNIGDLGGFNAVLLTSNQTGTRSHTHSIIDPGHRHTINNDNSTFALWSSNEADAGSGSSGHEVNSSMHPQRNDLELTGITINAAIAVDAAQAHENRPPYYALAFIMKLP